MDEEKGPRLLKRRVLGRRDVRSLKDEAGALLGSIDTNSVSQATLQDGSTVYLFFKEAILARKKGALFPTLINSAITDLPSALVDMGAIPFVCNGADIMAPGIMEIEGEFDKKVRHDRAGLLSMANRGPDTDGSQFFITFGPARNLDDKHTIFGEVVEGMETVRKLEELGTQDGEPRQPLTIERARVQVRLR